MLINIIAAPNKIYCQVLSLNEAPLNFRDNIFRFESINTISTISKARTKYIFNNMGLIISLSGLSIIIHKDETINAAAVVVSPLNNWPLDGAILNFAKRTAAANANRKALRSNIFSNIVDEESSKVLNLDKLVSIRINHLKKIIAGATPKLTISAKESSCTPNSERALSRRATQPSNKSKIAARIINQAAKYSFEPINTTVIAVHPKARLISVIAFGKM